jgi:hypothetical protein
MLTVVYMPASCLTFLLYICVRFLHTMSKMLKDEDILTEVNETKIGDDNDYTGE